ncbi:hypothetical protein Tco_0062373, partial [Tanacetum coccineum]
NVYTAYPNPMDTAYCLSGRYPVLIFSTVYRTYSLNEYNVFDKGINTAYPGVWIRRILGYGYGVSWGMDTAYRLPVQF